MGATATKEPGTAQKCGWWALAALGGLAAIAAARSHAEEEAERARAETEAQPAAEQPAPV